MRPAARKNDLVVQKSGDELLVYDLQTNSAFCLNSVSAAVWQNCDGEKIPDDIRKALQKQFNSKVTLDLVWLALDQLQRENLLTKEDNFADRFVGLSRREVIKKVGIASAIALPLIMSLTAPSAAFAQSACNTGATCLCGGVFTRGNPCAPVNTAGCNGFSLCSCKATGVGTDGICNTL